MKIYIMVREGLVQCVYANAPADVEVIDLDTTDPAELDDLTTAAALIQTDPDFSPVW